MSIASVAASTSYAPQTAQSSVSQIQQEYQQLGKDLQSGSLGAAQKDFVTLQKDITQASQSSAVPTSAASASSSIAAIAQTFTQLGKDLTSGNLSAAQQDFNSLQQQIKTASNSSAATAAKGHRHHHGGGYPDAAAATEAATTDSTTPSAGQLLSQLGSSLSSGNLTSAQQSYSALEKTFTAASPATTTASSGTLFQAVV